MDDGLYSVSWATVEASFEIRNGQPYRVAPILRKRLAYWMTKAVKVEVDWESAIASINRPAEIKAALPISYILERHGIQITSGDGRLHCMCPFHADHDPSFDVYAWKDSARWGCWVCGIGGDVFDLLRRINPTLTWGGTVELAEGFLAEMVAAGWKEPKLVAAREWDPYLASRVLRSAEQSPLPAVSALVKAKGWPFSAEWLIATWGVGGLSGEVIIPYFTADQEITGLKHRTPQHRPISAPGSRLSGVLYGEWRPQRDLPVLLCESESDCWVSSFHLGTEYDVLGLSTGAGSNTRAAARLAGRKVYVAFDGDQAGWDAAGRWAVALQAEGCEVYNVDVPPGFDLASLPNLDGLRAIQ